MAKHRIRSWRSWAEGKNEMMITKDSIVRRNADGSMFHHSAPMPLTLDAAPVGSEVGGIGENSFGYAENNRTNRPFPQGKIGNTDPQRADGAIRSVLCVWDADAETEIVERDGLKYLLMWTPLQSGEGRPQSAITADPISRSAVSGPEASAVQDAHRQMFDRLTDHNSKKPLVARRALATIRRGTDTLEMINAANRDFWGKK
jgi:hypothetical protein